MGLIRKIIGQLFGNKNAPALSAEDKMQQYEREHQQQLLDTETALRTWLPQLLKEKGELAVSWECGGDEAIITFEDGRNSGLKEAFDDLEDYLYHKLELPSAGEFQMNGGGHVYMKDDAVKVKYSSVYTELLDYNAELEKEIYGEEEEMPDYSGDVVLFRISPVSDPG